MEKNENELMNLLEREKKERQAKERRLAEELEKKEEMRNLMEIE